MVFRPTPTAFCVKTMSKVSISISEAIPVEKQATGLLWSLHGCLGLPMQEIRVLLSNAPNSYLFRAELFMNDHVDVDEKIRVLLSVLDENKLNPYVLERSYKDKWDDPIDLDICHITKEMLLNILDDSVGDYA